MAAGRAEAGGDGRSGRRGAAGLAPHALQDEAAEEGALLRADAVRDIGQRAVRWLEGAALPPQQPPVSASPRATAYAIARGVAAAEGLPSSHDPDAVAGEGRQLAADDEEERAQLLRRLPRTDT